MQQSRRTLGQPASLVAFLLAGAAPAAMAQVANQAPVQTPAQPTSTGPAASGVREAGVLEEVLVTSRKRGEERLQDIPTQISAFSSETLEKMGVVSFADFAYQVPGMTFQDTGPGEKRYVLRGIQSAGQAQVAVYYDEVPAPGIQSSTGNSGSQTPDLNLFDMERIEVLKGPQGTTFGANSQTGTVRFILNKPQLDETAALVKVGAESLKGGDPGTSAYGMFNMPLIAGQLGLRFVGYYDKAGGYIDNPRLGTNEINWAKTTGGRALIRFEPTPETTIDGMIWVQKRDTGGASGYNPYDTFHVRGNPQDPGFKDNVPMFAYFETGEFNNGDFVQTARPDDQNIFSLTLTQDLGWSTLTAAGSYYERDFGFFRDNSWAVISLGVGPEDETCFGGGDCLRPDLFPELTDQTQDIEQKAFELRLNSTGDGRLQWLAGAFYRDRDSEFRSVSPVVDPQTGLPWPVTEPPTGFSTDPGAGIEGCQPCAFARFNRRGIEEKAVFGELSFKLTDQLEILGGLRQFEAEQNDDGFYAFQFPLFGDTLPPPDQRHFKEDQLIKKFQVSWRPTEDLTIFALASQGFRLGGTNQANIAIIPPGYESDSLWNYELGVKSSWFGRRLTINSSAFLIDWDNIQVSGQDPTGSFGFVGNAGSAQVTGLEFEVFARPLPGFDLSGGFSWLPKRELTENQVNDTIAAPGRKGDELPRIPEFTADFSAQYSRDVSAMPDWTGWVRAAYIYHGESNTELRPTAASNRLQRAYDITNFRLGASNYATGVDIAVFVNNVFDEHGDVFISASTATPTVKYTTRPRTIGLELSKRF